VLLDNGGCLWLIGGTSESVQLAQAIASLGLPCIVSVTTATAQALYLQTPSLQVWVGRMDTSKIERFLQEQQIVAILDASHPYAVEISQQAYAIASVRQIPYLRFERLALDTQTENTQIIVLDSFETLLAGNYLHQQRVLLTVGSKVLPLFRNWQQLSTLYARIIPAVNSLEVAISAGFSSERIIAVRPPISPELEKALWRQWNISLVITKASGVAGGEDIKRTVAAQLSIPLIIISRPAVDYPQQTSDLSEALEFCQRQLK